MEIYANIEQSYSELLWAHVRTDTNVKAPSRRRVRNLTRSVEPGDSAYVNSRLHSALGLHIRSAQCKDCALRQVKHSCDSEIDTTS